MTEYVLQYFPIRGKGEFIRYIFAYGRIKWTDEVVPFEEWPVVKSSTPMGALPVLEIDGKRICQSLTIGRFLASRIGIVGSDELTRTQADMLVDGVQDLRSLLGPYSAAFRANNVENMKTEWQKCKAAMRPWFERYEHFLGNHQQWFCDSEFTWADLVVAEFADKIERCIEAGFIDEYPKLKAHWKQVHELPNIAEYVSTRQPYLF